MNVKKLVVRALPMVCAACMTALIAGCGDESSTPTTPAVTNPTSSATVVNSSDATAPVDECVADPNLPNCSEVPPASSASAPDNGGNSGEGVSSAANQGGDVSPITATFVPVDG